MHHCSGWQGVDSLRTDNENFVSSPVPFQQAGGGTAFIAHTDDAGGGTQVRSFISIVFIASYSVFIAPQDIRLVRVPAADHPPGSLRAVLPTHYPFHRIVSKERGPAYEPTNDKEELTVPLGYVPQVDPC
jgi:hypothetical protein